MATGEAACGAGEFASMVDELTSKIQGFFFFLSQTSFIYLPPESDTHI